ncbi:MAG: hypothetical protein KBA53_01460 [Thermoclostridium sp.]|nr:hypothetical protein [Thermoclostridium sp.]
MKKKALIIVLLAVFVVVVGVVLIFFLQNNSISKKIQGAWTLESMDVGTVENRRTREDAEFMFYIMKNNYSCIRDFTPGESDGKMLALADRDFAADAGTYEFDGKDLVVHHKISMFPVLGSMTFTCTMEDDSTLVLEPQYDKMVLPGLDIKPSEDGQMGYGDIAVKYVFKRME